MSNILASKEAVKYKFPHFYYEIYPLRSKSEYLPENPWHWHTEFELCYVINGSVIYKTSNKEIQLKKGDVLFINADVAHSVIPINPSDKLHLSVHFIDDIFVSGGRGNTFDVKYVYPIKSNSDIEMILFDEHHPNIEEIRKLMEQNIEIKHKKEEFWEFKVRNNICRFWEYLVKETQQINATVNLENIKDQTLRAAMTYIHEHYADKITVKELADFIHVSVRGCSRLFMKYLKTTPMNYLYSVRLQKASEMLSDPNKSIGQIALENGFSSGSHFSKIFKEQYKLTPLEYRNRIKTMNK